MAIMKKIFKVFAVLWALVGLLCIFIRIGVGDFFSAFLFLVIFGGSAYYLWRLSGEDQGPKIPGEEADQNQDIKRPEGNGKKRWSLVRGVYWFCLVCSVLSFIMFLSLVSNTWDSIQSQLLMPMVVVLGFLLFSIYFLNKIRKSGSQTTNGSEKETECDDIRKRLCIPLIILLLAGVVLAWVISASFFTFGAVNAPNDGKCDYDDNPATIFIMSDPAIPVTENSNHLMEFCTVHFLFYTLVHPVTVHDLPIAENSTGGIDLNFFKNIANLSIVVWALFLLFVIANSLQFPEQGKKGLLVQKPFGFSVIRSLVFTVAGTLAFIGSLVFIIALLVRAQSIMNGSVAGNSVTQTLQFLPLFIVVFIPCILFSLSIIHDSRN